TPFSVNHRLPSGPAVIPAGTPFTVGTLNWVMTPAGVMRPILFPFPPETVNQRLPSGPTVIWPGWLFAGSENSVSVVVAADTTHGSAPIAVTSSKRRPPARTHT